MLNQRTQRFVSNVVACVCVVCYHAVWYVHVYIVV